ncbi:MAG: DUF6273 domain-containing protein [Clostridiales bacterium]|nr:DUF6273 domain-containing protein [Clostridiales bacterium]
MKKLVPLMCLLLALALCAPGMAWAAGGSGEPSENAQTGLEVGDTVCFGHYEQDNDLNTRTEPIEWIVLAACEESEYLLVSRYVLDAEKYNDTSGEVTWEQSTLRKWLNGEFYDWAFSDDEKALLVDARVTADRNPQFDTDPGNDTDDKVFLLSAEEAGKYFADDAARMCAPTEYAKAVGGHITGSYKVDGRNTCGWWLRTSGKSAKTAAVVMGNGEVYTEGAPVISPVVCVRPAVRIRIEGETGLALRVASPSSAPAYKAGDKLYLGTYEQDDETDNGPEPIEWIVLDRNDKGEYLLITRYGLDAVAFNETDTDVNWEHSSLRQWLNTVFFNAAFSPAEQELIAAARLKPGRNPKFGTNPGAATDDRVFLLNLEEAEKYFRRDTDRRCAATLYAREKGAWLGSGYKVDREDACWWWLRSPGEDSVHAAAVTNYGGTDIFGQYITNTGGCVRPAIWSKLDQ